MPRAAQEIPDLPVTQRRLPAAAATPPATAAARSVFDLARPAPAQPLPEIVIRKGVPMPPATGRTATNTLLSVLQRMEVGDSVELPTKHAKSLIRIATKYGSGCAPPRHFVFRTLSKQLGGVWRDL